MALGSVGRLGNATEKRSIRNTAKTKRYSFRDMYKRKLEMQSI